MSNNSTVTNLIVNTIFCTHILASALFFLFYKCVVKYFKYDSYFAFFFSFFPFLSVQKGFFSYIQDFLKPIIVYDLYKNVIYIVIKILINIDPKWYFIREVVCFDVKTIRAQRESLKTLIKFSIRKLNWTWVVAVS